MSTYLGKILTEPTPQSEPLRPDQVQNSAGGFVWAVDDWKRLERFLILGSEGGSYYATERKLTLENAKVVERCIYRDGARTVSTIVAISEAGRAPKNGPALFALAMCMATGDNDTRARAADELPRVARTASHLFEFVSYVTQMRGWGRVLRGAVGGWYYKQSEKALAYQLVKYRQRNGYTHADLLRLSHPPSGGNATRDALLNWALNGWQDVGADPHPDEVLRTLWAFETAQRLSFEGATTDITKVGARTAAQQRMYELIADYALPREALPTEWLSDPKVWDMLLWHSMPLTALIRNLGKMTAVGAMRPLSDNTREVVRRLGDVEYLRKSRIHPFSVLLALKTYQQGHGDKGSLTWQPIPQVVDALDAAFYGAFRNVVPTGKRWLLALDVSGSMGMGGIAGSSITPREGSAAMALITAATERNYHIVGFSHKLVPLDISPRDRLDQVITRIARTPMGGTDCAQPMVYAMNEGLEVDAFATYTDSETWFGSLHPHKALQMYRKKSGIAARNIVVGMVANGFSIADPTDAGEMDVVGFDAAAPAVMADFVRDGGNGGAETAPAEEE